MEIHLIIKGNYEPKNETRKCREKLLCTFPTMRSIMQWLHTTLVCCLEPKLRVPAVELEALVDGDVSHPCGRTCCRTTVESAVVRDNVVLGETPAGVALGTIAEEQVGASTRATGDFALTGSFKKLGLERTGVLAESRVLSHEVSHNTSSVGACHRGTREGVNDSVASAPRADNLLTRSVDVNALSDVGKRRDLVINVDRANSDDVGVCTTKTGGSTKAGICAFVSSGNRNMDTRLVGTSNNIVDSPGPALKTP
jgi:hypothetical protein